LSAPLPPPDIAARRPELVILPRGLVVERFFTLGYDPIFFDRGRGGRLNAPDSSYGVLYSAEQVRGAFAETFLREPGRTLLPIDLVQKKGRVSLRLVRELRLVRLMGIGLARLGATAEVVHSGLPYDASRAWSQAIHDLPSAPDGIAYSARHDDEMVCYALFEGRAPCVEEVTRQEDIDKDWFWDLAELYGIGIAP
jgi:hypothetical protein